MLYNGEKANQDLEQEIFPTPSAPAELMWRITPAPPKRTELTQDQFDYTEFL